MFQEDKTCYLQNDHHENQPILINILVKILQPVDVISKT